MLIPLADLKSKISAKIHHIDSEELLMRLVELGIMPGVELSIQNRAPFNGPMSVKVNGAKIIMRNIDASFILVESV